MKNVNYLTGLILYQMLWTVITDSESFKFNSIIT